MLHANIIAGIAPRDQCEVCWRREEGDPPNNIQIVPMPHTLMANTAGAGSSQANGLREELPEELRAKNESNELDLATRKTCSTAQRRKATFSNLASAVLGGAAECCARGR